jgi:hypothetical protein
VCGDRLICERINLASRPTRITYLRQLMTTSRAHHHSLSTFHFCHMQAQRTRECRSCTRHRHQSASNKTQSDRKFEASACTQHDHQKLCLTVWHGLIGWLAGLQLCLCDGRWSGSCSYARRADHALCRWPRRMLARYENSQSISMVLVMPHHNFCVHRNFRGASCVLPRLWEDLVLLGFRRLQWNGGVALFGHGRA